MSGKIFHAPFLAAHPAFEFKAVLERHQKQAQLNYPGVISYDHPEQLFNDAEIELLVINTPNNTHYQYALQALQAGKHVLIEKPATVTSDEAKHLFEIGQQLRLKVMIYQNRRYNSDFLSFKNVIENGRLGRLLEVHMRIDRYRMTIGQKQFKESKSVPGNGLMYDLGSHLLDGAISLFGKPSSFQKTTAAHRPGSEVDDYFHFHLQYPDQLNVYLTSGLLIAEPEHGFVAHGTHGSFLKMRSDVQESQLTTGIKPDHADYGSEPEGAEGKLVTISENGEKIVEWVTAPTGGYSQLFNVVFETIRYGVPFPVKEHEILSQLEMLEC